MVNIKKISFISILITLLIFCLAGASLAQEQEEEQGFEIKYPEFGGVLIEKGTEDILPNYVKYIFNFAIGISGLIAFGSLIYGASHYLTSVDSPSAMSEAKDRIFSALLGIVILFSSFLILTTINPELKILQVEYKKPEGIVIGPFDSPGVYLLGDNYDSDYDKAPSGIKGDCVEENHCLHLVNSKEDLGGNLSNKVSRVKLVQKTALERAYRVILFNYDGYQGDCALYATEESSTIPFGANSAWVFKEDMSGQQQIDVQLCPEQDFKGVCQPYFQGTNHQIQDLPSYLKENVRSIEVKEDDALVVLKGNEKCGVFTKTVPDLSQHDIGSECGWKLNLDVGWPFIEWKPCPEYVGIFPLAPFSSF